MSSSFAQTTHNLRSHNITVKRPSKDAIVGWDTDRETADSMDRTYNPHKLGALKHLLEVNLLESRTEYHLETDLPGISKDCIEICIDGNCLFIRAEKKMSLYEDRGDAKYHIMERNNGKLERCIKIPDDADTSSLVADFSLGHLQIVIPKFVSAMGPVKIPIRYSY